MGRGLEEVYFILTLRNKPITKDISRKILNFTAGFMMTWQAFSKKLLPNLYQSACFNYTTQGILSKGDCFEKCLIELLHDETNGASFE